LNNSLNIAQIKQSWLEYKALATNDWRRNRFFWKSGGYVAIHRLKTRDNLSIPGIKAEVKACFMLASMGKHVLRLPENIPELIDNTTILGIPFRELLKYKPNESNPRGYPDAYFDEQTWDFKTSTFNNEDSLRQTIKDGRKAQNIIFFSPFFLPDHVEAIRTAIGREYGSRVKDDTWKDLPNLYYLSENQMIEVWKK